ncbi:MAG: hypothetical protein WCC90_02720, partial [Methylocella sp.]
SLNTPKRPQRLMLLYTRRRLDSPNPCSISFSDQIPTEGRADKSVAVSAHVSCSERKPALRSLRRTHWGRHRLATSPNVSDKEARSGANCMVLHPACHDDPVEFYNLHGFYPDNLRRK